MESIAHLSLAELNASALDHFVYQPVSKTMISYLASAAFNVIACDSSLMPATQDKSLPPTPPRTPEPRAVSSEDGSLPTLEEFITQLVVSSNVQVPTLMSTLVYLTRLKSRLQPMARGLRCTTHRIFLASLILAAKYLNDSSPKNKHWASYSHISAEGYSFGFSRTEVNLMEKQLLFLLDWDLRITEEDLYRELDAFLAPLRERIQAKHLRREMRRKVQEEEMRRRVVAEQQQQQQQMMAYADRYPSPPSSRGHSRSRQSTPEHMQIRLVGSSGSSTPPGLSYSSSASSYASSSAPSSRAQSRAATPLDEPADAADPYLYVADGSGGLHESPVQIVLEEPAKTRKLLPYEISAEELRDLQEGGGKAKRARRGVWGRILGGAVAVR